MDIDQDLLWFFLRDLQDFTLGEWMQQWREQKARKNALCNKWIVCSCSSNDKTNCK